MALCHEQASVVHQHRRQCLAILGQEIVLDGQQRLAAQQFCGNAAMLRDQAWEARNLTVNTEPLPCSLVTVTSPPIMRANLQAIARPSPVQPLSLPQTQASDGRRRIG
jgi:hypothetical protein